jgi:hypothetical protein
MTTEAGDPAFRIDNASTLLLLIDGRLWLPYLQAHVYALFSLGASPYWYHLLPVLYLIGAAVLLIAIGLRVVGEGGGAKVFVLLVVLAWLLNPLVLYLRGLLFQEIFCSFLVYLALLLGALELRRRRSIVIVAALALLTRETAWFLLGAFTLVRIREARSEPVKRALFFLWGILGIWFSLVPLYLIYSQGRLPRIPAEWPLMLDLRPSFQSTVWDRIGWLGEALELSNLVPALFLLCIVAFLVHLYSSRGERGCSPQHWLLQRTPSIAAVALGAQLSLMLMVEPSTGLPVNVRKAYPLLELLPLLLFFYFRQAAVLPQHLGMLCRSCLIAIVITLPSLDPASWFMPENPERRTAMRELYERTANSGPNARVLLVGPSTLFLANQFIDATLYSQRGYMSSEEFKRVAPASLLEWDLLILPVELAERPEAHFRAFAQLFAEQQRYALMERVTPERTILDHRRLETGE